MKILEPIVLAGVIIFLGFVFLIEVMDLFIVRPIYQKLFKKRRRRRKKWKYQIGNIILKKRESDIWNRRRYVLQEKDVDSY